MSFFNSLNVSVSALNAQNVRMDTISQNLSNVDTTRTADGGVYKRKAVIFEEITDANTFTNMFGKVMNQTSSGGGVKVSEIVEDESDGPIEYNPTHPDADEEGYVIKPNVNVVEEMINMISANRAYETNLTAINTTKSMISKTLEISS
ncbi:MAG: flagellar basal body rod protein FlgC [bacterium]